MGTWSWCEDEGCEEAMATNPVAGVPSRDASWLNSANALTLLRLLLVPAFVTLFFASGGGAAGWLFAAAGVFLLAAVTDRVDGELARRRGVVTDFGKVVDPIADKALIGAALVSLSVTGELAWWMTAAVLSRELGVTLLRFLVLRHGVMPASHGGKVKTVLQVVAILVYLLPHGALPYGGVPAAAQVWVMGAAVAVTVATGLDYLARGLRLRRISNRRAARREARGGRIP